VYCVALCCLCACRCVSVCAVSKRIKEGQRPAFHEGVKSKWKRIIERCWAADPAARPSCHELLNMVESDEPLLLPERCDEEKEQEKEIEMEPSMEQNGRAIVGSSTAARTTINVWDGKQFLEWPQCPRCGSPTPPHHVALGGSYCKGCNFYSHSFAVLHTLTSFILRTATKSNFCTTK